MGLFGGQYKDEHHDAHDHTNSFPVQFDLSRRTSVSAECVIPPGEIPSGAGAAGAAGGEPGVGHPANGLAIGGEAKELDPHLIESFRSIFLFRNLSDDSLRQVFGALVRRNADAGTTIIKQGDEGDYFYIVEAGEVEYTKDGVSVGASGAGSCFGELALLYNSPRAATVTATSDVKLWALDRFSFKNIMVRKLYDKREHSRAVLSSVDILKDLDATAQSKLADALQPVTYKAGEVVIHEGDAGDNFYLIDQGEVEVTAKGTVVNHLAKGAYFGELALLYNTPRKATVTALTGLKLEKLDKSGFERLLGPKVVEELRKRDPTQQTQ